MTKLSSLESSAGTNHVWFQILNMMWLSFEMCERKSFETEKMDDKRTVKNVKVISKYLHELLFEPMGTEIESYNNWLICNLTLIYAG